MHTFNDLRPPAPHLGLVEYVSEFTATLKAPVVHPYIYEVAEPVRGNGNLWVMPAGRGDEEYQSKLAGINWQDLYRRLDGYLLFEDLKTQWRELYNPDYVFIDSRTGHTEVEGICTRQLPDAVVNLFFPNEQNLAGLRQVVSKIRAEAEGPRHKEIHLHFVMSNVPDLDDEEEILNNRMADFRNELAYEELTATVHRYESFSLLNQVIFTFARPKSRLAREYRALKDAIVAENIEDREGAVTFLKGSYRPWGFEFDLNKKNVERRLDTILKIHHKDGEILFLIAMLRKGEQRFEETLSLLDQAIVCGNRTGDSLLQPRKSARNSMTVQALSRTSKKP